MSRVVYGVLALFLAVFLVSAPVGAQELPLDAEVVAQRGEGDPQAVKSRFAPQLKSVQIDLQTAKVELARLLASPQPDRSQVKAMVGHMLDLQRKKQLLLVDQIFDTLESIPPERREEFLQPIIEQLLR